MRSILIVGAGKSSPYLIKYLLEKSKEQNLHLNITDVKIDHLLDYKKYNSCTVSTINILNDSEREEFILKNDRFIKFSFISNSCITFIALFFHSKNFWTN